MRNRLVCALLVAASAACRDSNLPIAETSASDLEAGRRIYQDKCASCHNTNGDGRTITGRPFAYANLVDGKWRVDGTPDEIARQVRRGHDPMPKFESKLTDEEIREVVAYVLELERLARAGKGPPSGEAR